MKTVNVNELNKRYGISGQFEKTDEEYYSVVNAVKESVKRDYKEKPIILISGPSGSGKTTTAEMLESMLDGEGVSTHTVSIDNYFRTVTEAERGNVDYESPTRVDGELLSEHIEKIARCEEVEIPIFDFVSTMRSDKTVRLKRKPDELVIFEGIHALNPSVITAPKDATSKIYISVRTRVSYGDKLLPPEYVRLMRRIARDKLFRGRSAEETLKFYDEVKRGEDKYVLPFKRYADYSIDSFIGYEVGVYKSVVESDVSALAGNYETAKVLCEFLKNVKPLNPEKTPYNSLIREFIGR